MSNIQIYLSFSGAASVILMLSYYFGMFHFGEPSEKRNLAGLLLAGIFGFVPFIGWMFGFFAAVFLTFVFFDWLSKFKF